MASERDKYEVANQLSGYIDMSTPDELAAFLRRESDEAAKLADTIERYEAAGWQPISTAPKDGTVFDAWCEHGAGHRIHNAVWENRYGAFFSDDDGVLGSDLSHWMPLPLAPDALRSQDKGEG